jgi:hypothetical protein
MCFLIWMNSRLVRRQHPFPFIYLFYFDLLMFAHSTRLHMFTHEGVAYKLKGQRLPKGLMPSLLEDLAAVEVEYECKRRC